MSKAEQARVRTAKASPMPVGNVKPPKWLKKSRKATEIWNELAPLLQRLNLLTDLDAGPFARYCRYVAEWIAADVTVQKEGTWFETVGTNDQPTKKRHPAWQAMQDIEKMLREMEATFGMRPDTRYKIMRDQAAAHGYGHLPLWGDQQPQREDQGAESVDQEPSSDVIGALGKLNSAPPGHLN